MPKLRQPERLETLCLQMSSKWIQIVGKNLIPVISKQSRIDQKIAIDELNRIVEIAHSYFERFVPFTLYKTLTDQVMKVINELVEYCKETADFRIDMGKFLCQINVAVRLSDTVVSKKQMLMDFEELPKMIRTSLYLKLGKMSGLEYLNLGSLSGGWNDMETLIINGLSNMKNLKKLCLSYDCTDKILQLLARKCPDLLHLDLSNSKYINDQSVFIIQHLKKLKYLQLYKTGVTMEGIITLLLRLPELWDIGRYDELARCLEYIDEYHPSKTKFELRQFASICSTTKQIKILCEKCPNIESISLFHNVLFLDLMTLIGLNKLTKLKLSSCDFFADQVKSVLEVKGCNISYLNLEHVDEIDLNSLIYISQFCPDLKTLILCNCVIMESTSLYCRRYQIPPFMNLENLTLVGDCTFKHIEFLLCNAYQIKFVHFGTQIPTNDELFDKIILNNQLAYLEELRILHSDFLTIKTAYNLINNCPNLCKLFELESWVKVMPLQLDELKDHVKRNNYLVDLISFRKFVT